MSATTVDSGVLEQIEDRFERAVVSWVDADGYPLNAPARFEVDATCDRVTLHGLDGSTAPAERTHVLVTFSHVRPQPGIGYDERRYVNLRGTFSCSSEAPIVQVGSITGWDEERMPFFEYCERNTQRGLDYLKRLSETQGREVRAHLSPGWKLFSATRVPFLSATLVPVWLGALIARADGFSAWWLVALSFAGAACIHLGLNVVNDLFDARSGADDANVTPTPFSGGSRVMQHGIASPAYMWGLAVTFFGLGVAVGVGLAAARGVEILWLGMAGVFLSIAYTAPPLKLAYRGLGDAAVAAGFGPIMVLGTYFVVAQRFTLEALWASLPVALLVMLILYVNQVPDRLADERAGKRTVAVRLSRRSIVTGYAVFAYGAFALIVSGVALGILTAWALIAVAPMALVPRIHRSLDQSYDSPYGLMGAMGFNIALHGATGLLLIVAFVLRAAV